MRLPNGILAATMSHKTDYPTPAAFQGHFGPWPGGGQEQSGRDMPTAAAATAVVRLDSSRLPLGKLFPEAIHAAPTRLATLLLPLALPRLGRLGSEPLNRSAYADGFFGGESGAGLV